MAMLTWWISNLPDSCIGARKRTSLPTGLLRTLLSHTHKNSILVLISNGRRNYISQHVNETLNVLVTLWSGGIYSFCNDVLLQASLLFLRGPAICGFILLCSKYVTTCLQTRFDLARTLLVDSGCYYDLELLTFPTFHDSSFTYCALASFPTVYTISLTRGKRTGA